MQRLNFHLTERQIERLRAASEATGLPVAELVRRAVDEWLSRNQRAADRVARHARGQGRAAAGP